MTGWKMATWSTLSAIWSVNWIFRRFTPNTAPGVVGLKHVHPVPLAVAVGALA